MSNSECIVDDARNKRKLFAYLDKSILENRLTDLHTHLMGMGSADFWVSRIIENYIPNVESIDPHAVKTSYKLSELLEASGFDARGNGFNFLLELSLFEARFFEGFDKDSLRQTFKRDENSKKKPDEYAKNKYTNADNQCILNEDLVKMLHSEDERCDRKGPLRALVRNWFEFLSSDGRSAPLHTEVLESCKYYLLLPSTIAPLTVTCFNKTDRGQFYPSFCPRRFTMKDPIIEANPCVLGILLNTVCARYETSGVQYIEFSFSCGDLLDPKKFKAIRDDCFTTSPFKKNEQKEETRIDADSSLGKRPRAANTPTQSVAPHSGPVSLPPTIQSTKLLPKWRQHCLYVEKPKAQKFFFLAAFGRDKQSMVHHHLENGAWVPLAPQPADHRAAYAEMSEMAQDLSEIKALFLHHKNNNYLFDADVSAVMTRLDKCTEEQLKSPTLLKELCDNGQICHLLRQLAVFLCSDENIAKVYDCHLNANANVHKVLKIMCAEEEDKDAIKLRDKWLNTVVGLDWVGDELGHPFCVFSHKHFIDLIKKWRTVESPFRNSFFGVRFHAGEGPIRPSTIDLSTSPVRLAFYLHMYILCEGLKTFISKFNDDELPKMRIGHGVAFLFGCDDPAATSDTQHASSNSHPLPEREIADDAVHGEIFRNYLKDFRENVLKDPDHQIVCELNPTSNHMLLSSSFHKHADLANHRTLPTFLKEGVPVVLGTDDDGIWAIHKCKKHHQHISVGAEYCQAIENGDITNIPDLERMLKWGRSSAFALDGSTKKTDEIVAKTGKKNAAGKSNGRGKK